MTWSWMVRARDKSGMCLSAPNGCREAAPTGECLEPPRFAGLRSVREAVAGRERTSVFYVVWYDPPTTSAAGTFIDELIQLAGGRNVFADAPGLWPQVSMEEVVRRQPDIILVSQTESTPIDLERFSSAVGWRELRAVREGRLVRVDANLYNRPGPRVAEAAQRLARLLHPEAFADETGR